MSQLRAIKNESASPSRAIENEVVLVDSPSSLKLMSEDVEELKRFREIHPISEQFQLEVMSLWEEMNISTDNVAKARKLYEGTLAKQEKVEQKYKEFKLKHKVFVPPTPTQK